MTACKTSSQLFVAARDAQTERAGARVKVRLPNALHRDITACAAGAASSAGASRSDCHCHCQLPTANCPRP